MSEQSASHRAKILVVDDEKAITALLGTVLDEAGYKTFCVSDSAEGLKTFFQEQPDLAILDIMMPGMDGGELCRRIREFSEVPIIFLTAKSEVADRVKGLRDGADYYLTKPVSIVEVLAVVESVLRRSAQQSQSVDELVQDSVFTIQHDRRAILVQGERVVLTPLEFRLLTHLVKHPRHVFGFQELLRDVWDDEEGSPDVVRRYVHQLRKKVEETPETPQLIVTKRGFGYSYEPPD